MFALVVESLDLAAARLVVLRAQALNLLQKVTRSIHVCYCTPQRVKVLTLVCKVVSAASHRAHAFQHLDVRGLENCLFHQSLRVLSDRLYSVQKLRCRLFVNQKNDGSRVDLLVALSHIVRREDRARNYFFWVALTLLTREVRIIDCLNESVVLFQVRRSDDLTGLCHKPSEAPVLELPGSYRLKTLLGLLNPVQVLFVSLNQH